MNTFYSFVIRQINQIKKGGFKAIIKKLIHLLTILFSIPLLIIAIPLVLAARLIRPFVLIRFGPVRNDVIGHFAFDTEYYLTEKDLDQSSVRDYLYFSLRKSPNEQWEKMVKRKMKIHPIFKFCDKINRILPGWKYHFVKLQDTGSRDIKNIFIQTSPHLSFTEQEHYYGQNYLKKIGMTSNQNFVSMIARGPAYKEQYMSEGNRDWSYHSYRNSDIQNYSKTANALAKLGYFVFRLGKGVKKKIEISNSKVIDYATSLDRSDFLDIFLSTNCSFFINGESGLLSVPEVFRVPIVFVNLSSIEYILSWNDNIISIPKKYWLKKEKKFLTFKEIFSSGVGRFLRTDQYEKMNIELIENTPDEILNVSFEMHKRLNSTWKSNEEDETLQKRFWKLLPKSELHGEIQARIGASFLRQNQDLLN